MGNVTGVSIGRKLLVSVQAPVNFSDFAEQYVRHFTIKRYHFTNFKVAPSNIIDGFSLPQFSISTIK